MKTLLKQLSDRLPPRVSSAGEAFAALVLLAGAILRAAGYTRSAIWFDEAVPLYRASLPFWEMLHNRSEFSGNMLWEIILRPFVWLSRELWSLRLPALLCGMGTLWLAWRMMKRLSFSGKEMAFASVFIAFFPGLIWPAQDAKQYSLLTFLFLLAADFAVEARWLGLFATCGLLTYTHLVGPAYGIGALAMAWYLHPKELKRLLGIGAGMLLSWMPYLLWSLRLPIGHLQVGQISPASLLYSLGVLMWYTTLPKLGWAYSHLLIVFGSALALITKEKRQVALVLLLAATFGSMLFVSMTFRNVMIYRTMSGLLAPIGLFLGSSLAAEFPPAGSGTNRPRLILNAIRATLALVWMVLLTWGLSNWNAAARGGYLDRAAQVIRHHWQDGDVLYYASLTVALPFDYYLSDLPNYLMDAELPPFINLPDLHKFEMASLESIPHRRAWVIYQLADETPPEVTLRLMKYTQNGKQMANIRYPQMGEVYVILTENESSP